MEDARKEQKVKAQTLRAKYKSATLEEFIDHHGKDISRSGMFIKTSKPPALGALLKIEIQLKDGTPVLSAVGRVVQRREEPDARPDAPAGMGLRFLKIEDDSKPVIDAIVGRKGEAAGPHFESLRPQPATTSVPVPPAETHSSFFGTTSPATQMPPEQDRTEMRQMSALLGEALRIARDEAPPATAPGDSAPSSQSSATVQTAKATIVGVAPVSDTSDTAVASRKDIETALETMRSLADHDTEESAESARETTAAPTHRPQEELVSAGAPTANDDPKQETIQESAPETAPAPVSALTAANDSKPETAPETTPETTPEALDTSVSTTGDSPQDTTQDTTQETLDQPADPAPKETSSSGAQNAAKADTEKNTKATEPHASEAVEPVKLKPAEPMRIAPAVTAEPSRKPFPVLWAVLGAVAIVGAGAWFYMNSNGPVSPSPPPAPPAAIANPLPPASPSHLPATPPSVDPTPPSRSMVVDPSVQPTPPSIAERTPPAPSAPHAEPDASANTEPANTEPANTEPANTEPSQPLVAREPVVHPTTRPAVHPTTRPAVHPTTRPAVHPTTRPAVHPTTRPAAEPTNPTVRRPSNPALSNGAVPPNPFE